MEYKGYIESLNSESRYFDRIMFISLALVLPSVIIFNTAFWVMILTGDRPGELKIIENKIIPRAFYITAACSLLAIFLDFTKIAALQVKVKNLNESLRKSFFHICLIFINAAYTIVLYLYSELCKFSDFPVGRD